MQLYIPSVTFYRIVDSWRSLEDIHLGHSIDFGDISPQMQSVDSTVHYCSIKASEDTYTQTTVTSQIIKHHINSLMQKRHNSSALAMDLRLFCIKPSICSQICI